MAGPRLLSPLTKLATTTRQTRSLHMTGAAPYASRLLTSAKPIAIVPRETAEQDRGFNTSRTLKKNNDSSTVDFTFLPEAASGEEGVKVEGLKVPVAAGGVSA